ncbi:MAG: exodeoxyribonuclease III [Candidatus Methylacidiphilales bacterium]|nr:exodeoxyribonuclease III [Candidatus Methylacidiphilales bacterium]
MILLSWNVNGIRATLGKGFLDFVAKARPDILGLQETKAEAHQVDLALPDHDHAHWNSAVKKGYSGTAVFSRFAPRSVTLGMGIPEHDQEGRIINAEFNDFILVNVYTPNSQDGLRRLDYRVNGWDVAFLRHIQKLEKNKPVVVCGDLNVAHQEIDIARPKENVQSPGFTPEERKSFQRYLDAGWIDTFREFEKGPGHYSWWSFRAGARARNVGWRIDYFLLSPKLRPALKRAWIMPEVTGSDHCPVGIELSL